MGGDAYTVDRVTVSKLDESRRLVGGWAYVSRDPAGKLTSAEHRDADGNVVDHSGTHVDVYTVEKAMHRYIAESRVSKDLHESAPVAECVSAITFTPEVKRALGLPDDYPEGAYVVHKVHDDATWARVQSGERPMLSIHGTAVEVAA